MHILALTPDEFQTLALGWIGTLTAIAIATGYAVAKVWPLIADIKARFDGLKDRVDRQGTRQDAQANTLTAVALSVPPSVTATPLTTETPSALPGNE